MSEPAMPIPDGFIAAHGAGGGFHKMMGPVYRHADGRIGIRVEERHTNPIGITDGGFMMTLADHSCGFLIFQAANSQRAVTVTLNCDFMGSARVGEWIECRPTITRKTRSLAFARAEITCGERMLLVGNGIWKFLEAR